MFLFLAVVLVIQGCGGGGGGSVVSTGSGSQTGTLSGTITLPGGTDPAGALVMASKMSADGTQPASALKPKSGGSGLLDPRDGDSDTYTTVSDLNGNYTFNDIEEGDYFVVATKGAYKASHAARVQPRAATVINLALTPTGHIQGQVLLSGDEASGNDLSGTLAMVKGTSYIAATDPNGFFVISQIPVDDNYNVMFSRPGYEVLEYDGEVVVTAAQTTSLPSVMLVVDSDERGSIGGVVMRPESSNHQGILIAVTGTQFMAVTDDEGNWIINGVPAGTYTVTFGDLNGDIGDEHIALEGVEIIAGELTAMPTMTLQPTGLEGMVSVQGGDPAMGTMVKIQELGNEGFAITSSDGNYHILGIDAGTYTVTYVLTGYTPAVEEDVQVTQGEILELNVTLIPGGTTTGTGDLEGTVTVEGPPAGQLLVDLGSLDPIPLGQAAVMLLGTNFFAVTDNNGYYHVQGIPAGTTYELFVDGDEDGLDTSVTIPDVSIVEGQTVTQDATLIDQVPPDIWGTHGVHRLQEETLTGGATAMRVFFSWAEDVSQPVVYNLYYAPADSWDGDEWDNNTVLSIPQGDVEDSDTGDDIVYFDITTLTPGVEYVFGIRPADVWGNEDRNNLTLFATLSGGEDIFPPKWTDDSRQGIQTVYALENEPGSVAVEFESATDNTNGGEGSNPVIYNIYYAPVNEFNEANWSLNTVLPVSEYDTRKGSYYQRKVVVDFLTPITWNSAELQDR